MTIFVKDNQAALFYEYIQSIESDFRKEFPNSCSIMFYTFKNRICNVPEDDNDTVCVAQFPPVVVRWIMHREDCPMWLSEILWKLEDVNLPVYPTWDELGVETGMHFRIEKELNRKLKNKVYGKDNRWVVEVCYMFAPVCPQWYEPDCYYNTKTDKFVHANFMDRESLGLSTEMGSTKKLKSLKAVFNYIRKHNFPVGTYIKVREYKNIFNQFYITITK